MNTMLNNLFLGIDVKNVRIIGLIIGLLINPFCTASAEVSKLWGQYGKTWSSSSRLPDFSYAGYHGGADSLPIVAVQVNVKDFGAKGDGIADDTLAFMNAIKATSKGAILIPTGRYKITKVLNISKSGIVLRGEGEDKSILYFPNSLTQAVGDGKLFSPGQSWSWSGGFIAVTGYDSGAMLSNVTASAKRGEKIITLASTTKIRPGQWIRLMMTDTDGSLAIHLHAEQLAGAEQYIGQKLIDFSSQVESVSGNTVVLKRPLRTDIRLSWNPAIYNSTPSVSEVGIEYLRMEFPAKKYVGHHQEPGYNAISFEGVSNCWVNHVKINNADSGIFLRNRTKFCTINYVNFKASSVRLKIGYGEDSGEPQNVLVGGHHGILIAGYAQDNLISHFRSDFRFIHDIGVSAWAAGNVFSNVIGIDMSIDHHRRCPFENLFTEINAGEGTRLWQRSGDLSDGPPSGARETFWNLQTKKAQIIPTFAVQWNIIGMNTSMQSQFSESNNWLEAYPPTLLTPTNLYLTQQKNRIAN